MTAQTNATSSHDESNLPPSPVIKTIAIGSDHAGYQLKTHLKDFLESKGFDVTDMGCPSEERADYPDYAQLVAEAIASKKADRGVLVCGSGIGICIAANRHPAVRAVRTHDVSTAVLSRWHNDSNIACFGQNFIAPKLSEIILEKWLDYPFEGGRHQGRIDKMSQSAPSCSV